METKRGFVEWMNYIQNVNQGNKPAMERALTRLAIYDNENKNVQLKIRQ